MGTLILHYGVLYYSVLKYAFDVFYKKVVEEKIYKKECLGETAVVSWIEAAIWSVASGIEVVVYSMTESIVICILRRR